jgi:hypothetical protein
VFLIKLNSKKPALIALLFTTLFIAAIISPWFTNNRGIVVEPKKEFGFQRDAEVLVISKIAAELSNVSTDGYNLGRLGSETKIELNTWGNPDPYIAIDQKGAKDFVPYETQYGIQSLIYSKAYVQLVKLTKNMFNVTDLRYVVTYLFVFINLLIFIVIFRKIDRLYAFIWLFTIFTSPWVMLFSRNIYWSIFSFYIPILMALLYSCANSIKYKISIVFLLNFTLIFRFLMGYEFYTTLIITCLYFCFLPEIIRGGFKIKERIKEILAILTSMFLSLFIAIIMHGYLSPDGIVSNFARMLNRSNARSATGSTPISTMVSTIESYFLNWPKMFGWPIWYSENNVLVIPLPIVSNIKVTGQDFIILSLIIVLMFFISLIQKNKSISNFLPIISILGPLSWLILYPIHEDEHGIDFFLMYFGSIQAILYILLQGLNNLVIKNLNLGGALFKRKIS